MEKLARSLAAAMQAAIALLQKRGDIEDGLRVEKLIVLPIDRFRE
ncbi:MAG TPA: hypothetical protein VKV32_16290 [Stellaceae bacterium]|nr:hypothetical protein [Stellaceae bacterium]